MFYVLMFIFKGMTRSVPPVGLEYEREITYWEAIGCGNRQSIRTGGEKKIIK